MTGSTLLVGDGVENPYNARALLDAAAMFGAGCVFRDEGARLRQAWEGAESPDRLALIDADGLAASGRVVVVDNLPGAREVYGSRLARRERSAVVVGNERRGVSAAVRARADGAVEIPMAPGPLNSLNVAAAAGVALYYLSGSGGSGGMVTRAQPDRRRPQLLLAGPTHHVEAGSAIRSAACFGWRQVLLDDRNRVWFGVDRSRVTEGRAAARRARNRITVVPVDAGQAPAVREVVLVGTEPGSTPLHRLDLARGPQQLVVVTDGTDPSGYRAWARLPTAVRVASIPCELPGPPRYRLAASIAMAEIARQVGRASGRRPDDGGPSRRRPTYRSELELDLLPGEDVDVADLAGY